MSENSLQFLLRGVRSCAVHVTCAFFSPVINRSLIERNFRIRKYFCFISETLLLWNPQKFWLFVELDYNLNGITMWTGLQCEQNYNVNRITMWTELQCEQDYNVNRITMWTELQCEQDYNVNRITMWTGL